MEKLGLSLTAFRDAKGNIKDFTKILSILNNQSQRFIAQKVKEGKSLAFAKQQAEIYMKKILRTRGLQAYKSLVGLGDMAGVNIEKIVKLKNQLDSSQGTLAKYASTKAKTLDGSIKAYESVVEALRLQLSTSSEGSFKGILDDVVNMFRDIKNSDAVSGFGRMLSNTVRVAWKLIKPVVNGIKNLFIYTGKFYDYVHTPIEKLLDGLDWVSEKVTRVTNLAKDMFGFFTKDQAVSLDVKSDHFKKFQNDMAKKGIKVPTKMDLLSQNQLKNVQKQFNDWAKSSGNMDSIMKESAEKKFGFGKAWNFISQVAGEAWNRISEYIDQAWKWIKSNVVQPLTQTFSDTWKKVYAFASTAFSKIMDWASEAWQWIVEKADQAMPYIMGAFTFIQHNARALWLNVGDFATASWKWVTEKAKEAWNWMKTNVLDPINNTFRDVWQFVGNYAGEGFNWVVDNLKSMYKHVKDVAESIGSVFGSAWDFIKTGAKAVFSLILKGISWIFQKIGKLGDVVPDSMGGKILRKAKVFSDNVDGLIKKMEETKIDTNLTINRKLNTKLGAISENNTINKKKLPGLVEGNANLNNFKLPKKDEREFIKFSEAVAQNITNWQNIKDSFKEGVDKRKAEMPKTIDLFKDIKLTKNEKPIKVEIDGVNDNVADKLDAPKKRRDRRNKRQKDRSQCRESRNEIPVYGIYGES